MDRWDRQLVISHICSQPGKGGHYITQGHMQAALRMSEKQGLQEAGFVATRRVLWRTYLNKAASWQGNEVRYLEIKQSWAWLCRVWLQDLNHREKEWAYLGTLKPSKISRQHVIVDINFRPCTTYVMDKKKQTYNPILVSETKAGESIKLESLKRTWGGIR